MTVIGELSHREAMFATCNPDLSNRYELRDCFAMFAERAKKFFQNSAKRKKTDMLLFSSCKTHLLNEESSQKMRSDWPYNWE